MSRVTLKTSTIFISIGGKTRVYRSVDDVPAPLRKKLEQSTNGLNSATILIADRRGRQEIARAIRGLPSNVRPPQLKTRPAEPPAPAPARPWYRVLHFLRLHWAELLVPPALGAAVWLLYAFR